MGKNPSKKAKKCLYSTVKAVFAQKAIAQTAIFFHIWLYFFTFAPIFFTFWVYFFTFCSYFLQLLNLFSIFFAKV